MKKKFLFSTTLCSVVVLFGFVFGIPNNPFIVDPDPSGIIYPIAAQVDYIFYDFGKKNREEFQGVEFPTMVGYLQFGKDKKAFLRVTSEYNFEGLENFLEEVNESGSFVLSWKCGGGKVSREDTNFLSALECHLEANGIQAMDIILGDPSKRRYSFRETRAFDIDNPETYRPVTPHILGNVLKEHME